MRVQIKKPIEDASDRADRWNQYRRDLDHAKAVLDDEHRTEFKDPAEELKANLRAAATEGRLEAAGRADVQLGAVIEIVYTLKHAIEEYCDDETIKKIEAYYEDCMATPTKKGAKP
ncbi:MAG: hypothetical protein JSW58_08540 [Candidatus Latescibacterota bacterium]|nr:MAG: hypothetical protein JSW58_08540 [Candidatus Latescibacterota bacterium]